MQTKLTLRLDDRLIRRAKKHAGRAGKSLSRMVADYFSALTSPETPRSEPTPTVAGLKGILKGTRIDSKDYRAYLEEKHR